MAFSLKLVIALQILLVISASARPSLFNQKSTIFEQKPGLLKRLKLDVQEGEDGSSACWESLFELQSCTGEVVLFFMNGETYLGQSCCAAIRTIEHHCWPSMLSTIGYTSEEGDILHGYCDETGPINGGTTPIPHQPPSPPNKH